MRQLFPLAFNDWSRRRIVDGRQTTASGAEYVAITFAMYYSDDTQLLYSDSTPTLYVL
mgnify:CR=1 FL=1